MIKKIFKTYLIIALITFVFYITGPLVMLCYSFYTASYNAQNPEKTFNKTFNIKLEHPKSVKKAISIASIDPMHLLVLNYSEKDITKMKSQDFWIPMEEDKITELVNEYFLKWLENDEENLKKYEKNVSQTVFENKNNYYAFFEFDKANYAILVMDVDSNVIYEFYVNL